jgi:hypothetical protein
MAPSYQATPHTKTSDKMEVIMLASVVVAFALFFFLGRVQSHWIAPAVLYVVSFLVIFEFMLDRPVYLLLVALLGTLALYYGAFALGRLASSRART